MRKHNGMRPQDVAILLKMVAIAGEPLQKKDLARDLFISPSEISESLNRSLIAGLVNTEKKKVHKLSFLEFIRFGLPYVFPVQPGATVNGLPTAVSYPFMKQHFHSESVFVWPDIQANERGQNIEPLYKDVVKAAAIDDRFYKLLALTDVVRVGKVRELSVAMDELKIMFTI